jgi:hypothetical protein
MEPLDLNNRGKNRKKKNMLLEEVLEGSTNTISHGRKLN